jgi:hypothetical protein
MSTAKKLVLLLLTVIPTLYVAFYVAPLVSLMLSVMTADTLDPAIAYVLLAHLAMMLWLLLLIGWYCRSLYRSTTLNPSHKIIWTIVFVLTAPFGLLVFWYLEVWRARA